MNIEHISTEFIYLYFKKSLSDPKMINSGDQYCSPPFSKKKYTNSIYKIHYLTIYASCV